MNPYPYRSASRESPSPLGLPVSRGDFAETFTSFPAEGIKDPQNVPNIISNIFNRFNPLKTVASNVQQALSSASEPSLSAPNNDGQLLNSLAATTRPSRIGSNLSQGILTPTNASGHHSRSPSGSVRSSSIASRNRGHTARGSVDLLRDQDGRSNQDFNLQNRLTSHASSNNNFQSGKDDALTMPKYLQEP